MRDVAAVAAKLAGITTASLLLLAGFAWALSFLPMEACEREGTVKTFQTRPGAVAVSEGELDPLDGGEPMRFTVDAKPMVDAFERIGRTDRVRVHVVRHWLDLPPWRSCGNVAVKVEMAQP